MARRVLGVVTLVLAIAATRSAGATTSDQVWPKLELYLSFRDTTRLVVYAESGLGLDPGLALVQAGAEIEQAVTPLRARLFPTIRVSKRERATLGLGYQYGRALERGGFGGSTNENRIYGEGTFRALFPAEILAGDRNRVEGRALDGDWSWRYRNRLRVERGFEVAGRRVVPLASAELFYDSRPGTWTRLRLEAGADLEELLGRGTVLELYYVRQYDRGEPAIVNALGVTVDVYR